jgi:hypothetical protein
MRIKLKRLHRVESKGRVYYYAWRGGPRIKTDAAPGSPAFMQAYNEVVATARAPTTDKVVSLIKLQRNHRVYKLVRSHAGRLPKADQKD